MKSHKSLIHILIPKSFRNSPLKYTSTIKHTNTNIKNKETRMNTFSNYNNKQSFRINVRLKKVDTKNNTIRLPKLCSPSKDIKLLYRSKIKNNTTLFSKYIILVGLNLKEMRQIKFILTPIHMKTIYVKNKFNDLFLLQILFDLYSDIAIENYF